METFRESPLGQILRWISSNTLFLYPEERPGFTFDPEQMKWKSALAQNENQYLARYRASGSSEGLSCSTAHVRLDSPHRQETMGKLIVDWYGPEDQSNPRNWSPLKKKGVALIIWCDFTHSYFV